MADPFLTLPGASFETLQRADVNLFNADQAHMVQGMPWDASQVRGNIVPDGFNEAGFGFGLVTVTDDSADGRVEQGGLSVGYRGNIMRTSALVENLTAHDITIAIMLQWAGGLVGNDSVVPAGATVRIESRRTDADPDGTLVSAAIRWRAAGMTNGDTFRVSEIMWTDDDVERTDFVPSVRVVGDFAWSARVSSLVWGGDTVARTLVSQWDQNQGRRSWQMQKLTNGNLRFSVQSGGGSISAPDIGTGFADGTDHTLRFLRIASTGVIELWFDDVAQGPFPLAAGAQDVVAAPFPVQIGAGGSNVPGAGALIWQGNVSWLQMQDGDEDGPVVYRMDAADVLAAI